MASAPSSQANLNAARVFHKPIVTEIAPATEFYKAEEYHQDYFRNNPDKAYCRLVIVPKLSKFKQVFKDKLKTDK